MEQAAQIDSSGRLVVPAPIRRAMGLRPGDEVVFVVEEDGLRLLTAAQAVRRAQSLIRRHVPSGRRLSEELLADRRTEAERG